MKWQHRIIIVLGLVIMTGCGGGAPTVFLHPEFDFSYVEKVSVVPFENLTTEQGGGARATRFFTAELLASGAFSVIEPGEVTRVLADHGLVRTAQLTTEQIISIGEDLNVQGLFLGTINESSAMRSGSTTVSVISVVIRLVETDTGATVWSASNSSDSSTFWSSIFGSKQQSKSEVLRACLDDCLDTLLD